MNSGLKIIRRANEFMKSDDKMRIHRTQNTLQCWIVNEMWTKAKENQNEEEKKNGETSAENDEMWLNCFVSVFLDIWECFHENQTKASQYEWIKDGRLTSIMQDYICGNVMCARYTVSVSDLVWTERSSSDLQVRILVFDQQLNHFRISFWVFVSFWEAKHYQIRMEKIRDFSATIEFIFFCESFFWIWQCDTIIFTRINCALQFQFFYLMILQFFNLICKTKNHSNQWFRPFIVNHLVFIYSLTPLHQSFATIWCAIYTLQWKTIEKVDPFKWRHGAMAPIPEVK